MQIVDPEIEFYSETLTTPESEVLRELKHYTEEKLEYSDMLSGSVVGRLLAMLIKCTGALRVLEIGTFTGYSAISMAEALPADGELITCEHNARYEEIARRFFEKSEHGDKIRLKMGPALETIEGLAGPFDMVYLDADKVNYPDYYRAVLPKLNPNGVIVVDNAYWGGMVLDAQDEKAEAIDRLNRIIAEDQEVEQVLLSVRDGLNLVRKR